MLFTKPLRDVTFADVQAFCDSWPEGVRVEYKRIEGDKIPKVVSSFANTVGGVWIIGVKTDKITNRVIPPIEGIPFEAGIEERITQSCYANLYPPLLPDIQIVKVPETSNMVVIVQVHESAEAPHAIENSTRVYVRTNSTTERIELADIDRIDYLLKRRRDAEGNRQDILKALCAHSPFHSQMIQFRIGPTYPYRPVLSRENLTERIKGLSDIWIKHFAAPLRDGYMAPSPFINDNPLRGTAYFAASIYGMIVYAAPLSSSQVPGRPELTFISLDAISSHISHGMRFARSLLKETTTLNLTLELFMEGTARNLISYTKTGYPTYTETPAVEGRSAGSLPITTEDLNPAKEHDIQVELLWQLMWPFNWHDRTQIERAVLHS